MHRITEGTLHRVPFFFASLQLNHILPSLFKFSNGVEIMKKIIFLSLIVSSCAVSQFIERDPCGYPDTTTRRYKELTGTHWGYGFDSLAADIQRWKKSPFVKVDSVGATVQNRPMFLLTVEDTLATFYPRHRI